MAARGECRGARACSEGRPDEGPRRDEAKAGTEERRTRRDLCAAAVAAAIAVSNANAATTAVCSRGREARCPRGGPRRAEAL